MDETTEQISNLNIDQNATTSESSVQPQGHRIEIPYIFNDENGTTRTTTFPVYISVLDPSIPDPTDPANITSPTPSVSIQTPTQTTTISGTPISQSSSRRPLNPESPIFVPRRLDPRHSTHPNSHCRPALPAPRHPGTPSTSSLTTNPFLTLQRSHNRHGPLFEDFGNVIIGHDPTGRPLYDIDPIARAPYGRAHYRSEAGHTNTTITATTPADITPVSPATRWTQLSDNAASLRHQEHMSRISRRGYMQPSHPYSHPHPHPHHPYDHQQQHQQLQEQGYHPHHPIFGTATRGNEEHVGGNSVGFGSGWASGIGIGTRGDDVTDQGRGAGRGRGGRTGKSNKWDADWRMDVGKSRGRGKDKGEHQRQSGGEGQGEEGTT